jgi:hypothetical protein
MQILDQYTLWANKLECFGKCKFLNPYTLWANKLECLANTNFRTHAHFELISWSVWQIKVLNPYTLWANKLESLANANFWKQYTL